MEHWFSGGALPGPQQIMKTLTGSLGVSSFFGSEQGTLQSTFEQCPRGELSCKTAYHGQDTCCFNYPGGQMLQTQFWDADPAIGPEDSWTIHGLWPDHCNGGFDQYCDNTRRYSNISLILVDAGRRDLLDEMTLYWKDWKGHDADLWEHEWNKHGTCVSTLEPRCYSDYFPQAEVVDYFDKTVELFHTLPTYKTLADAGITPSYMKTYTLHEIEDTLSKSHGAEVTVRCRSHNLNEVWYFYNIEGPLQTGKFVPSAPDGQTSNCPRTGIRYQPKTPPSPSPPPPKDPESDPEPGIPFLGRGNLMVSAMGSARGCVISRGTWFTSGTCATFRGKKVTEDTFTLESHRGICTFEEDIFTCGPHITSPMEFSLEDGKLAYRGNTSFFADKAPKGTAQSSIFASEDDHLIELAITWRGS